MYNNKYYCFAALTL